MRVIDVSEGVNATPKLHLSHDDENPPNAALVYCWGKTLTVILPSINIEERRLDGLPFRGLRKTIRDAIVMTRSLGLRFI
jgi:hypothetical protein